MTNEVGGVTSDSSYGANIGSWYPILVWEDQFWMWMEDKVWDCPLKFQDFSNSSLSLSNYVSNYHFLFDYFKSGTCL